VHVVLLPLYPFIHVLPFNSCLHLEVHVPHLEMGVAPMLRKMVVGGLLPPKVLKNMTGHMFLVWHGMLQEGASASG
jgi:hypothetical protein